MKKIIYAGDTLVTGDDIAAAVLRCGKALAGVGAAETIEIPVMDASGEVRDVTLLIGPSSQIVVSHVDTDLDELIDADVVARLDALTAQPSPRGQMPEAPVAPAWSEEL